MRSGRLQLAPSEVQPPPSLSDRYLAWHVRVIAKPWVWLVLAAWNFVCGGLATSRSVSLACMFVAGLCFETMMQKFLGPIVPAGYVRAELVFGLVEQIIRKAFEKEH